MQRLDLAWTWETGSPLHVGSGLSRPGRADRLVQRDDPGAPGNRGSPYVPGDAVKGAIRMAAEQLLAWLGCPQASFYENRTAEPVHPLLQALFGGATHAHYSPARAADKSAELILASTAINPATGRAKENTLRAIETIAPGAHFTASCTVWLGGDQQVARAAKTLLVSSLASVETIGGKTGTGSGRVRIVEASLNGARVGPGDVSQVALDELCDIARHLQPKDPERPRPLRVARLTAEPERPAALVWRRLTLALREPTTIGRRPLVSNQAATLDWVPATTLRGALRAFWLRSGRHESEIRRWLASATRWTPAYPAVASESGLEVCAPVPLSYSCPKEVGVEGIASLHDRVSPARPPRRDARGQPVQWRPLNERWMRLAQSGEAGCVAHRVRVRTEVRMHVARNYTSGTKVEGALYSREGMSAADDRQVALVAWAQVPEDVAWPGPNDEIFVGKRTSAGGGRATLAIDSADGPWPESWQQEWGDSDVYIQLLSPTLVRDGCGYAMRTLTPDDWKGLSGFSGAIRGWSENEEGDEAGSAARTAPARIPSWMRRWGHGRAPGVAIAAGSAWRLRCEAEEDAARLRTALRILAEEGIGERRHEGFGWLAVDPPWLGRTELSWEGQSRDPSMRPTSREEPVRWPGLEEVDPGELVELKRKLPLPGEIAARAAAPLQELAQRAREETSAEILGFLVEQDKREHDRQERKKRQSAWGELGPGTYPRRILETCAENPDLFRFAIEALLIRTPTEQREGQAT